MKKCITIFRCIIIAVFLSFHVENSLAISGLGYFLGEKNSEKTDMIINKKNIPDHSFVDWKDLPSDEKKEVEEVIIDNRYNIENFDPCKKKNFYAPEIMINYSDEIRKELKIYNEEKTKLYDKLGQEAKKLLKELAEKHQEFHKQNNCYD